MNKIKTTKELQNYFHFGHTEITENTEISGHTDSTENTEFSGHTENTESTETTEISETTKMATPEGLMVIISVLSALSV